MNLNEVTAIVLAAGKGTRMQATTNNKVVYTLADRPMVSYTVENVKRTGIQNVIVVVGFASDSVKNALREEVTYANQGNPLGTGHAVKVGLEMLNPEAKYVITLYGDDSAFYPSSLFSQLLDKHEESGAAVTLVTITKEDPTGLGRIVRDNNGQVLEIVEEKNATDEQKKITEINTGLYCFGRNFIESAIHKIEVNPISGEYYLTDIVSIAQKQGKKVEALHWDDTSVWYGVNTPEQHQEADQEMRKRVSK